MSQQLNYPTLLAAASWISKDCAEANKSFLMCKKAHMDPAECLSVGSVVMACGSATVAKLSASPHAESFEAYSKCLDKNGNNLTKCTKLKAALESTFA
mmetsp:Transcript_29184/g.65351  ORF Transcript_29184/g.65351 Transcript_29184/m.65351 type:complete len:98 (-) Transcript_29184:281-574(-)